MDIAVYCGSYTGNNDIFTEDARKLGRWIGEHEHGLVYGAGKTGLMKVVADAVIETGGKVTGVIPNVPTIRQNVHEGIDRIIEADTMPERKTKMIELSDAFIALPGGTGTFDEISEIISLNCLGVINCPVVLFDSAGYYTSMRELLENAVKCGFSKSQIFDKILFSDDVDEIGAYIENWYR